MARSRHISAEAARDVAAVSPVVPTFIDLAFEAQARQLEALLSWQESLATCARD